MAENQSGQQNGYGRPLMAFRFLVKLEGRTVAAFTRISGIKMEVRQVTARAGDDGRGVLSGIPVLTQFAPVTLSFGVVGELKFLDWLLAAGAGDLTGPTGLKLKRDLDISAVDDRGKPAVTWTLKNAYPIAYELLPMDSGRSEVLMEDVTLAYDGIRRESGGRV